jgi:hypothetical protein
MSRPERAAAIALVVLTGALAAGCGKSNLVRAGEGHSASGGAATLRLPARPSPPLAVAIPLKLTAARASAFAKAVDLLPVDFPGSRRTQRGPNQENGQKEAECAGGGPQAIGGGRSAKLDRGADLTSESISSSVLVLPSARAAQADLAYTDSREGLDCYAKLLRRKLAGESTSSLNIGHVVVSRLTVDSSHQSPTARGIRISSRVSGVRTRVTITLIVDAVAFDYGPAEIELYTTSFIHPVAGRTEEELLGLMLARARLSRL